MRMRMGGVKKWWIHQLKALNWVRANEREWDWEKAREQKQLRSVSVAWLIHVQRDSYMDVGERNFVCMCCVWRKCDLMKLSFIHISVGKRLRALAISACVRHDSFITYMTASCVTWLIQVWLSLIHISIQTFVCVIWISHVWHESFTWDMTHSSVIWLIHVWHNLFMCVTWIFHVCGMTLSRVPWLNHAWHDSFMYHSCMCSMTHPFVTRLSHTRDKTDSHLCQNDSYSWQDDSYFWQNDSYSWQGKWQG